MIRASVCYILMITSIIPTLLQYVLYIYFESILFFLKFNISRKISCYDKQHKIHNN